jgi:hypothetical protein
MLLSPLRGPPPERLLPPALLALLPRGVLGPVLCLGAVERLDVNQVLSALVRRAERVAILGGADAADAFRRGFPGHGFYHLTNPDRVQKFSGAAVDTSHPQHPLVPTPVLEGLCGGVLDLRRHVPEQGFVGLAVNLIHLTPEQLAVRISVGAVANAGAGAPRARPGGGGGGGLAAAPLRRACLEPP